ncbi:MAG: 50S ribosomal protein L24 [Candidatus Portnoybacteria bacterium]|nr:50S ribosomal protein L24 [Candidatus Portnoybacteria bacterium]
MKIKKDDTVKILAGKDKGKQGKVLEVVSLDSKIVVEGINLAKKHNKPRKTGEKGQIISIPRPISVSNAKIVCPKCGAASRIGYKLTETGKFRICKKCQQEI